MVGLVVVSHSRPLAEALLALVRQVAVGELRLACAAGVGPDRKEFGTDAVEIAEAIQSVYSSDGVVVLMDLGSAILSAETARDLLPPEIQPHLRFCAAPIVEGAIAASVQAGLGSSLDTVCREAQGALAAKAEQLGETAPPVAAPAPLAAVEGQPEEIILTLSNLHGLHARPAARFVKAASAFAAKIQVRDLTNGKGPAAADSLNALAILGAVGGHQIAISALGPEATSALQALRQLVEEGFGEAGVVEGPAGAMLSSPGRRLAEGALPAVAVSEGVAFGPLRRYRPPTPQVSSHPSENPQADWEQLQQALEVARQAIQARRQQLALVAGESQAAIFDAHSLILQDPPLLAQARSLILQAGYNAAAAWQSAIGGVAASYRAMDDVYLQQRAADVEDVGLQVLYALAGETAMPVEFKEPIILVAQDLTPTQTAQLDLEHVLGLVTIGGGPTSHSAILARALGIPALAGAPLAFETLEEGAMLAVDGFNGALWIKPASSVVSDLEVRRSAWLAQRQALLRASHQPAATHDGSRIEVVANVGNVKDAQAAIANGAEGIGLLRTEFLYLTRTTPPSEAEQVDKLRQIGEVMGQRPVIVRTLDVGGDKALPYLHLPAEANPFLGVRAIRLSLQRPQLFITQLRAILQAGLGFNFQLMFPMVANLDEVLQARQSLEEAHQSLAAEGRPHAWPIPTGIMVEIPAAALQAESLAPHVDFFSIGTNDLTQYTLAAERGNPRLSGFADALHPAVLRLIQITVAAARRHGKWVGVCGELAGDPTAAPVLVGLGVTELSLNAAGIPRIKNVIRQVDSATWATQVETVLQSAGAAEARRIAETLIKPAQSQ